MTSYCGSGPRPRKSPRHSLARQAPTKPARPLLFNR